MNKSFQLKYCFAPFYCSCYLSSDRVETNFLLARGNSSLEHFIKRSTPFAFHTAFIFSPFLPFSTRRHIFRERVIIARCGPRIFTALRFLMDRKVFKGVMYIRVFIRQKKKKYMYKRVPFRMQKLNGMVSEFID